MWYADRHVYKLRDQQGGIETPLGTITCIYPANSWQCYFTLENKDTPDLCEWLADILYAHYVCQASWHSIGSTYFNAMYHCSTCSSNRVIQQPVFVAYTCSTNEAKYTKYVDTILCLFTFWCLFNSGRLKPNTCKSRIIPFNYWHTRQWHRTFHVKTVLFMSKLYSPDLVIWRGRFLNYGRIRL